MKNIKEMSHTLEALPKFVYDISIESAARTAIESLNNRSDKSKDKMGENIDFKKQVMDIANAESVLLSEDETVTLIKYFEDVDVKVRELINSSTQQ